MRAEAQNESGSASDLRRLPHQHGSLVQHSLCSPRVAKHQAKETIMVETAISNGRLCIRFAVLFLGHRRYVHFIITCIE